MASSNASWSRQFEESGMKVLAHFHGQVDQGLVRSVVSRICRQDFVSHNAALMRQVLQGNNLSAVYRTFLGLANLDRDDAILRGNGARRPAGTDALDQVAQFAEVAVLAAQTKRSRFLALLKQF